MLVLVGKTIPEFNWCIFLEKLNTGKNETYFCRRTFINEV